MKKEIIAFLEMNGYVQTYYAKAIKNGITITSIVFQDENEPSKAITLLKVGKQRWITTTYINWRTRFNTRGCGKSINYDASMETIVKFVETPLWEIEWEIRHPQKKVITVEITDELPWF